MEEQKKLIDDCFYVEKKKWGTWDSTDKEGKKLITSLTEDACINATRYWLKLKQENRLNDVVVSYSSTVDGKL
jgi:hypothetical protein